MTLIWPFPTKSHTQFRRIDQGWDLQAPVGTEILAVDSGTVIYAHDMSGFGDPYPVLVLDDPQVSSSVYYGHNHPEIPEGAHVTQGQVIAHALQVPGGNASGLPGWLEIGWWNGGPTGNGQAMYNALVQAPVWGELSDDVTDPRTVTDFVEFSDSTYKLRAGGGVEAMGKPGALHPVFHQYTVLSDDGHFYTFEPTANGGVFAYPGLPAGDKSDVRGPDVRRFYEIRAGGSW